MQKCTRGEHKAAMSILFYYHFGVLLEKICRDWIYWSFETGRVDGGGWGGGPKEKECVIKWRVESGAVKEGSCRQTSNDNSEIF